MSFGKRKKTREHSGRYANFEPSTAEELKAYRKRARKKEEAKKERRARIDTTETPRTRKLKQNLPLKKINARRFLKRYVKIIHERAVLYRENKKNDPRWCPVIPRYELREERERADANFIFDVQASLAPMSWKQLSRLIAGALEEPHVTTDYSEAFHMVQNIMHQVLDIETDEGESGYRLANRKRTLKLWPVDPIGERKVHKREAAAAKSGKKFGKRRDDDEEEDDEEEEAEDEEDEDDDEDEDEPRRKKSSKKSSKRSRARDDDEDDDEDEDDDDEDSDDEPRRKKVSKKKSAKADKSTKKSAKKSNGGASKADQALELFRRKKGAHVDEVAEKLDTSVPNVRSLIGSLRAKNHKIKNLGDGVFKL